MRQKRLLSWILIFVLLVGVFPIPAYAGGNTTTTTISGDGTSDQTGQMTITLEITAAEVTTVPVAETLKYNGNEQVLVVAGTAENGDMEYALGENGTTAPTSGWGTSIPTGTDAKDYYVWYRATNTHGSTDAVCVPVTIAADTYGMTITMTIKEMTVSAEDVSAAYDGQPHGITVNVTDPASGYTVKYGTTEGTYDLEASPTQTEVGTKTVYYQVTANNYVTKTGSVTVTIGHANAVPAAVTANNRTYDGTEKPLVTVDNSTLAGGTMQYALGTEDAATEPYTTSIPTATNAGTYTVYYYAKGDENHSDSEKQSLTVTVGKKDITGATITFRADELDYTGAEQTPEIAKVTLGGKELAASDYTAASGNAQTLVGTYTFTVNGTGNYTGTASVEWKIKPVRMTNISAEDVSVTYDGKAHGLSVSGQPAGAVLQYGTAADSYSLTENPTYKDAGEHTVYFKITAAGYEDYTGSAKVTITKAALSVKAEDQTQEYGKAETALTYTAEGLADGDTADAVLSGSLSREAGTDVKAGGYAITQGSLAANGNYTVTFTGATYTITKAVHENKQAETVEVQASRTEKEIDLSSYLESGASVVSSTTDGDLTITDIALSGTKLTFTVAENDGDKSGTIKLTVGSTNYADYEVEIPVHSNAKTTEIILDTPEDGAETAVTNVEAPELSEYTEDEDAAKVEVKLTVKPETEDAVEEKIGAQTVADIVNTVAEAFSGVNTENVQKEYLDMTVTKKVGDAAAEEVADLNRVLEIAVSYDLTGKYNPVVIREHDKKVRQFTRLKQKPVSGHYADGTFYTNGKDTIWIYAQYFSTYTIAYATAESVEVTFDDGTKQTQVVVEKGGKVTKPADPSKDGYTFTGWEYDDNGTKKAYDFDTAVTSDLLLTAAWKENAKETPSETPAKKPTPARPDAPTLKSKTDTTITVVAVKGQLYSIDGGKKWQTSGTFKGLKPGTKYSIITKIAATATANESPVSSARKVTTYTVTPEEKAAAKIALNAGLKVMPNGSKVTVKWGKVKNADRYEIYAAYCGPDTCRKIKTVSGSKKKLTFTKLDGKKLNLKKNVKVYVIAYRKVNGKETKLARSITAHITGSKNTKYTNTKKVKLKKSSYALKVKKTAVIKAEAVLEDKSKKLLSDSHVADFRYASSNKKVATVDENGKITAVGKGTCYIYVYAKNGYAGKIKVTVK